MQTHRVFWKPNQVFQVYGRILIMQSTFSPDKEKSVGYIKKTQNTKEKVWFCNFVLHKNLSGWGSNVSYVGIFGKKARKHHTGGVVCCMVVCAWLTDRHISAAASQGASIIRGGLLPKAPVKRNLHKFTCVVKKRWAAATSLYEDV